MRVKDRIIKINSINNVISEILILSRLQHPNIVRYYNSWVEPYILTGDIKDDSDFDSDNDEDLNILLLENNESSSNTEIEEELERLRVQLEKSIEYLKELK